MKIETVYTMKQPLSHIGESESTVSFLNTIRIAVDGKVEEVFALTGNSIRGTLRDCAARHLLDTLGARVGKKEFNILFSGGNISGVMVTDIDQAKKYRRLLPMVSIFGAGVGNQILAGKITQGFALPVCKETNAIIPKMKKIEEGLRKTSWKSMTGTISFTRFDDSKNTNYQDYLQKGDEETRDGQKEKMASTQMRYEVEYLVPGTQLYHAMNLCTEMGNEFGAFVAALEYFSDSPFLGGMGGKGFGLCEAEFFMDGEYFCRIENGKMEICNEGKESLDKYNRFLAENAEEIIEFLGAVKHGEENDRAV